MTLRMNETVPTRRPGRPRREESGDIDQQLIDAAMQMLAQHGPALTMNTIIAASGLSRKTVYARYPNKPALMAAVVRTMLDYGLEPLVIPDRPHWRESLHAFVDQSLNEVCQPQAMTLRRLLTLDPAFMDKVKPRIEQVIVRRYMDPLIAFLDELVQAGTIPPQDIPFAAEALTSLVLSESHRRFFQNDIDVANDPDRLDEFAQKLVRLFCDGILA
ncbi:TetR/AcrR family transcriptional regulator [Sphingobium sp. CAP-1]|uniref:TetR/AcrR family transcriptional regulator n=1 Tax=Sphingobium sp. CAP-1 TaxID=2676077 RepID=UPI0012BB3646|nr:TetR/AcrR family transcriptional regulator [Sphingobium sp. CAP-1]QGP81250.1 TetR family transcriptional regulator [Sphingobium sp. CAP-1]